jgi:excisionase family DNA binding protein
MILISNKEMKNMTTIEKKAVSIKEFATILDVSPAHAWRLVKAGKIPSVRLGHRYCIPISAINEMLGEVSNEDEVQLSA